MSTVLVGDVGGTNCRFATWDGEALSGITVWNTAEMTTLADCVARYQSETGITADAGCVAVAGPVQGGTARLTNTSWSGAASDLPGVGCLVNDLHAAARGIARVGPAHRLSLGGPAPGEGNLAVLGIGTGLGQALLVGDHVVPTEGGHTDFGPATPEQDALLSYLRPRLGRVTLESIVSGPGLGRILRFCAITRPLSSEAAAALASEPPGAVVFSMADREPACAAALSLFLSCVGSAAGDLALRSLPDGGVVICGGVLPRIAAQAADGRLRRAFEHKPPMAHLLEGISLSLVTHPHLGLLGAAVEAERLLSA